MLRLVFLTVVVVVSSWVVAARPQGMLHVSYLCLPILTELHALDKATYLYSCLLTVKCRLIAPHW